MEGSRNIGVTKAQAIVALLAGRLSAKSKSVKGPEKKVSTAVAREHSTGAIGSVGRGRQPQDQQVSRSISERGNRFSPVGPIQECTPLFPCHLLTMLDQAGTKSTLNDLLLNLPQFWFHDRRASRARAVVLSCGRTSAAWLASDHQSLQAYGTSFTQSCTKDARAV